MKKRGIGIILTVLSALSLFTGCASKGDVGTGKQDGYVYGIMGGCTGSGGVYVGNDYLLHYYDRETAEDVILCHKPDCRHEAYDSETNPDPVCDAALNKDLSMTCIPFLDGEYVYLFGNKDMKRGVIYRERADGSEREQLCVTEYQCLENMNGYVKGDTAYLVGNQPVVTEDQMGGAGSNKCYYILMAVNLTDGSCMPLSEIRAYDFQGLTLLGTFGDELYYYFSYRENQENLDEIADAESICDIYSLNMSTGEETMRIPNKTLKGYVPLGIHEGTLLLEKEGEDGKWYQYRLPDGGIEEAEQELSVPMTCFDNWVFYCDAESMIIADWEDVKKENGIKMLCKPLGGMGEESE